MKCKQLVGSNVWRFKWCTLYIFMPKEEKQLKLINTYLVNITFAGLSKMGSHKDTFWFLWYIYIYIYNEYETLFIFYVFIFFPWHYILSCWALNFPWSRELFCVFSWEAEQIDRWWLRYQCVRLCKCRWKAQDEKTYCRLFIFQDAGLAELSAAYSVYVCVSVRGIAHILLICLLIQSSDTTHVVRASIYWALTGVLK